MNPDQNNPGQNTPDPNLQKVYNPLSVMRENEQVICEIRRHFIGLLGVYVMSAIVIVGALAALLYLPTHLTNFTAQNKTGLALGAGLIIVVVLLYTYIARLVYRGNRWILTDDSLTQVTQDGLFRTHNSQLSLANLEDVTADQNGLLQSMFGYGVLKAETAGERSKFIFLWCPNPSEYARKILAARENFIMNEPEQAQRANDKLMTPGLAAGMNPSATPQIDPQQYQQFLQFQQMMAEQQQAVPQAAPMPPVQPQDDTGTANPGQPEQQR